MLPLTLPRLHMQDSTKPPLGCTTDIVPPRQPRLDERNRKPKRLVETAAGSLATTWGAIAAHISPPWFLWLLSHGRYWCLQTHLNQVWLLVPSPFVLQFTLDHVKCWFPSKDNLTEDTDNSEKKKRLLIHGRVDVYVELHFNSNRNKLIWIENIIAAL